MGKARRAARKQVRSAKRAAKTQRKITKAQTKQANKTARATKRIEARTTRKAKRVDKRTQASANRVNKRARASTARVAKRDGVTQKRINKRGLAAAARINKKLENKYGPIEDQQALLEASQVAPEVLPELEEMGIPIEDENDPVEVMTKYVQMSDDFGDPVDEDIYDDAFVNDEDAHDGEEEYENFNWKAAALRGVGGALSGVMGEFGKAADAIEEKAKRGEQLTKTEQAILNGKRKVEGEVKNRILDEVKKYAPWVIVLILAIILGRKMLKAA